MSMTPNEPEVDVLESPGHLRQQQVQVWTEGERLRAVPSPAIRFTSSTATATPPLRDYDLADFQV